MESIVHPFKKITLAQVLLLMTFLLTGSRADLDLVTSKDFLRMYKLNTTEPVVDFEIAGFKNYNFFGRNNTVQGRAGYVTESPISVEIITNNGINKVTEDDMFDGWVIITPFDNPQFVPTLETIANKLQVVKGIIFTYSGNPQISNPAPDYDLPKIISFAKAMEIMNNNVTSKAFPNSADYTIAQEHMYVEYCSIMNPAFKFYVIGLGLWGFATILHVLWTWGVKKDHAKHLQKIMLFVPIFFLGYTLIDYVFYISGPWNQANGVQYLQIVQIALVTIFNTLFVGLCGFISKGWSIMRNSFTREELSSITMIVGIFYLVYSAYFIASDIPSLKVVIIVILIIMYVWVALTCLKNCIVNIRTLKSHIEITGPEEIILDSLKLKKYLMVNFGVITLLFYLNKILHSALYTFIDDNEFCRDLIIVNLFVELAIVTYMLFTFRARKWPEYFSLDVFYQRIGGNEEGQEQLPKSVILNAVIPAPWVTHHGGMDMTLNGVEVNYFKVRNYRDPQVAVLLEASDQEAQQLQKLNQQEFKAHIYTDVKLVIEEELSDSSDSD